MGTNLALSGRWVRSATLLLASLTSCAHLAAATNIAPGGTGYVWAKNTSAISNSNRTAKTGINDNNTSTDVDCSSGETSTNRWEGAGVVFSGAQTISKVVFINGAITSGQDGFLEANCKLQFSADGSTWADSGWSISPTYPYTNAAGTQTYTFTGTQVTGKKGARIVGQVRVNGQSYYWRVREVQIFDGSAVQSYTITASAGSNGSISPTGSVVVAQGANQTFSITANSGYTVNAVTVDGVSQGAITTYTFNNVTANHTINATFKTSTVTQYTITASAGANGSISPSGSVTVNSGSSQTFSITPNSGYAVSAVTVDGTNQGAITTYTFSNVTANHTISAAFQASGSQVDKYGIKKLYATTSGGREWFNAWDTGVQRANDWGILATDPGLVLRGNTSVTIYGASGSRPGQMAVSGSNPRIYVRDSDTEAIPPAASVKTWNNVEVTFFANSNLNSGIGWAGMEAVVKTNHMPDTWDCQTRGYGGRFLFDGRIDFEKEVSHPNDYNVQQELGTWSGGLPINKWIGMKLVARNCDNNTHVKLELYREVSLGSETNPSVPSGGGNWELLGTYTDTGTWSAGYGAAAAQCSFDNGKTDRSLPLTWANWSVYLRTDDDNNKGLIQYLKWLSVREVDPLP